MKVRPGFNYTHIGRMDDVPNDPRKFRERFPKPGKDSELAKEARAVQLRLDCCLACVFYQNKACYRINPPLSGNELAELKACPLGKWENPYVV